MDSQFQSTWPRIVLHADMDAFYASIEQLDHPSWRGKPVIVGGESRRGVVSTASYEARRFGVHSAMSMVEARRRCPQAVVAPPRLKRYREISRSIMEAFARFSPLVEPLSLDEAFLDMTGAERLMGSPRQMAQALKQEVRRVTDGLTVSVGVAPTKYVAKVASDWNKPDGLTVVAADQVLDFLWPLPVKHLWGVGPRMQRNLAAMGLVRIGQVAHADEALLQRRLGRLGPHLRRLAWGQDERAVVPPGQAKSVGAEVTLEHDVLGHQAVAQRLRPLAREVARRLRANGLMAQGVRVKVKTASFRLLTRQSQLDGPTTSSGQLLSAALDLLPQFDLDVPSRLVGLAAFQLVPGDRPRQGELFPSPQQVQQHRTERLESTIDELQRRFGAQAIHFGDEEPPDGDSGDPPPR